VGLQSVLMLRHGCWHCWAGASLHLYLQADDFVYCDSTMVQCVWQVLEEPSSQAAWLKTGCLINMLNHQSVDGNSFWNTSTCCCLGSVSVGHGSYA
jgi:hypothetical protein